MQKAPANGKQELNPLNIKVPRRNLSEFFSNKITSTIRSKITAKKIAMSIEVTPLDLEVSTFVKIFVFYSILFTLCTCNENRTASSKIYCKKATYSPC